MSIRYKIPGATGKYIGCDTANFSAKVATFCGNNNLKTKAEIDAFIDGMTDAQMHVALKVFFKGLIGVLEFP